MAVDYIFCYTVGLLLSSFHQNNLSTELSLNIEEMCFTHFQNSYTKLEQLKKLGSAVLIESKTIIQDRFAEIIGLLSLKRFEAITERFVNVISPLPGKEQAQNKNNIVNFIRGMKYLKIQVRVNVRERN